MARRARPLPPLGPIVLVVLAAVATPAAAGDLTPPPGPIGPTMKTLDQVEPRTAVASLPGGPAAVHVIDQPGSYVLDGPLVSTSAGLHGIEIAASDVTIDLQGFALVGDATTGSGIFTTATVENVTVRNGHVRGWGGSGIYLQNATGALVAGVNASGNTGTGIVGGGNTTVRDCTAANNTGHGILVRASSRVSGCVTRDNDASGISVAPGGNSDVGGVVEGCSAVSNDRGIHVFAPGVALRGNSASRNTFHGLWIAGDGSLVEDNDCHQNGWFGTDGAGIRVTGTDNRIDGNAVTANDLGIEVTTSGNVIVRNTASGNATDYSFSGNQAAGPVVLSTTAVTTSSPWANIRF